MNILIVDDDMSIRHYLREVAAGCGHHVIEACDGEEGFNAYSAHTPDLILCDLMMPKVDGLGLLERVRQSNEDVVFVILTAHNSAATAMKALELKATNFLLKPIRFEILTSLLEKYSRMHAAKSLRREVCRMVFSRTARLRIPNRIDMLTEVASYLVEEAGEALAESQRFPVHLGLYELLVNAVEHGNLGISYAEKVAALEQGSTALMDLMRRRSEEPGRALRRVHVEFDFDGKRLQWTIEDEGEGFSFANLPNPLEDEHFEGLSGRGIFLAKFQFDELEYLGCGNRVRVTKVAV